MRVIKRWTIIIAGGIIIILSIIMATISGLGGFPVILAGLAVSDIEISFAKGILSKLKTLYFISSRWKNNNRRLRSGLLYAKH